MALPAIGSILLAAGLVWGSAGATSGLITFSLGVAGLLAYALSPRVQAEMRAERELAAAAARRTELLSLLDASARDRYLRMERRSREAARSQARDAEGRLRQDALSKLCWVYLELLATERRASIEERARIEQELARVERSLQALEPRPDTSSVQGLASRVDAVVETLNNTGAWSAERGPDEPEVD